MKKSAVYLIPVSACLLVLAACGGSKHHDNSVETQQQPARQENKQATLAHALNVNGRDVKGTIMIDTEENQNGSVVMDGDTNAIEGKNIEQLRIQAVKWDHEAIGILPVTDSFDKLEKSTEDMIKNAGDSFEAIEKGGNSIFYHCKIKVYDGKDLYGFIVYVKGKNKSYELFCAGNYMSPSSDVASGFIESKEDAMKVYKIAQTFQPVE